MKKILLAFSLLMVMALVSKAQTTVGNPNASETMTVTINPVFDLSITTPGHVFTFNSLGQYDTGIERVGASTLTYRSNTDWQVMVAATSSTYSGTSGTTPMPSSVIQVRKTGELNYITNLSTVAQPLTGAAGSRGKSDISIDYKIVPGYDYDPADYVLGVQYTLTNP